MYQELKNNYLIFLKFFDLRGGILKGSSDLTRAYFSTCTFPTTSSNIFLLFYVSIQLNLLLSFSKVVFQTFQIRSPQKCRNLQRAEFSVRYVPIRSDQKLKVPSAQLPLKAEALCLLFVDCLTTAVGVGQSGLF